MESKIPAEYGLHSTIPAETELHKIKDDSVIKREKNINRRGPRHIANV
jgi:hypothetical protein